METIYAEAQVGTPSTNITTHFLFPILHLSSEAIVDAPTQESNCTANLPTFSSLY